MQVRWKLRATLVVVLIAALLAGPTGCKLSGPVDYTPPTPTGIVFLEAPPSSLAVNASATVAASLTTANGPLGTNFDTSVSYSVSCGSTGACGRLGSNDEVGAVTYTAPPAIPAGGTVTVTASGAGLSVSATVTITPPLPIQVAFYTPPPASIMVGAMFPLSASITNDTSANPQVQWSVTCGGAACGSFNPAETGDEDPTTYAAPASIPPGGTVTVTMTSLTDKTKTASTTIAVTAAGATLANGTYVFQISGTPGIGASYIAGVLTAGNGDIIGGEQDVVNYSGTESTNAYTAEQTITGGRYGPTADGNLQITIEAGPGNTETLEGVIAANGSGFVSGLDGAPASGTLDIQTSAVAPQGGYAVSLQGGDPYFSATWIGGILNIDGPGSISGTGSILDVEDPGSFAEGVLMLSQSTVSAPDAHGRVVMKLYPAPGSTFPAMYFAAYMVDGTRMRMVETEDASDNTNFQGVLGGTALAQSASTGNYGNASLAGRSFVFAGDGIDSTGPMNVAGVLTANSDGTVTGLLNWNDLSGTGSQSPRPFSGTYSVDRTGRVTLTGLTDGSTFNYSLHWYLGGGKALLVSSDANDVFGGEALAQTAASGLAGQYGLNAAAWAMNSLLGELQPESVVGSLATAAVNQGANVSGYADTGAGTADFAVDGNLSSVQSGLLTGTLTGFTPTAQTNGNSFSVYVVDGAHAVLIETDNAQLVVGLMGQN